MSSALLTDDELRFKAVEDALAGDVSKQFHGHAYIQHIDITCDGCDTEPIIGNRFKCRVCEDRDLCETCMRALISARMKMVAEIGTDTKAPSPEGSRPKHWISKLKSDDGRVKWHALLQAVPCLHPTHVFSKMDWGPERAVFLKLPFENTKDSDEKEEKEESNKESLSSVSKLRLELATQFLSTFPPSGSSCTDVAWIIVDSPQPPVSPLQQHNDVTSELSKLKLVTAAASTASTSIKKPERDIEDRVESALEDWEKITSKRRPSKEDIGIIAKRHNILVGKWLIFPKTPEEADAAWSNIVHAAALGNLPGCTEAKISPTNPNERGYVICVYTEDYLNEVEVTCAATTIRKALNSSGTASTFKDTRLLYKADIYTYLGIYAKNEWGLKPTIYSSNW